MKGSSSGMAGSSSASRSTSAVSEMTRDQLTDVLSPPGGDVVSPPQGAPSSPVDTMTTRLEQVSVQTRDPVVRKGNAGKEVRLTANYVR